MLEPVSYTHLDVYKRQLLRTIPDLGIETSSKTYYDGSSPSRRLPDRNHSLLERFKKEDDYFTLYKTEKQECLMFSSLLAVYVCHTANTKHYNKYVC